MAGFTLSAIAKADLKEIGRYTERQWGRDQRNYYLAMLNECFEQIASAPIRGKECGEIRAGYRKARAGSHVIFYRQASQETIEIIRILHQSMDIETRLTTK